MACFFKYVFTCCAVIIASAGPGRSENWLLVQTNVFPAGCRSLVDCIDASTQELRNLMALDPEETTAFLDVIAQLSDVEDIPDLPVASMPADFPLMDIVPRLQMLEVQGKEDALRGLPGIYFDAARVAGDGLPEVFTSYFTDMLTTAGIPVLTEEGALLLPGAARMSVSLSLTRDNAGCIFPFRASLSLKEEVVLVRDPLIKLETTTWSMSVAQNFTNTNFTAEMDLRDAAQRFIDDYKNANAI